MSEALELYSASVRKAFFTVGSETAFWQLNHEMTSPYDTSLKLTLTPYPLAY